MRHLTHEEIQSLESISDFVHIGDTVIVADMNQITKGAILKGYPDRLVTKVSQKEEDKYSVRLSLLSGGLYDIVIRAVDEPTFQKLMEKAALHAAAIEKFKVDFAAHLAEYPSSGSEREKKAWETKADEMVDLLLKTGKWPDLNFSHVETELNASAQRYDNEVCYTDYSFGRWWSDKTLTQIW